MMRHAVVALCVTVFCSASPVQDLYRTSFLQTGSMTGLNVSSLSVSAGMNRESKITMGDADMAYSLVVTGDSGDFEIRHANQRSFVVSAKGDVEVLGQLASKGAMRIDGPVSYLGNRQWMLAASEDFANNGAQGWSNDSISICGTNDAKYMLGGYGKFAGGEVSKIYMNLPPHKHVRLRANYHMIDQWGGQTGYAKMDHRLMWTESHDQQSARLGVNICGGNAPESKFALPIDVVLPHECAEPCSITIGFGSTLTLSPTEHSFGVSDIMLYVR